MGAVSVLVATFVVGGVLLSARMRAGSPSSGAAAPAASDSRTEELVRRLDEIRQRIKELETRRDEIQQAQESVDEDRNLDARLAVNKELKQAHDEEQEVLAELESLSRELQETGR
jgi:DNA repair exonuclease SbcCD ATPase subunit